MDLLTSILRALADPTRCKILELLREGSRSVSELAQHFSMSRPAISKHLAILRDAELVASKRQGRQQIHELHADPLEQVRKWLDCFDASTSKARSTARPGSRAAGRDDWRCW